MAFVPPLLVKKILITNLILFSSIFPIEPLGRGGGGGGSVVRSVDSSSELKFEI